VIVVDVIARDEAPVDDAEALASGLMRPHPARASAGI
jgi:hypothetical protein